MYRDGRLVDQGVGGEPADELDADRRVLADLGRELGHVRPRADCDPAPANAGLAQAEVEETPPGPQDAESDH